MINYIKGTVKYVGSQSISIDIGAIGLECCVANAAVFSVGGQVDLHAYMHWNQEQGPSLYGFHSDLEKTVFMLVISCSGIGPKIGLSVLANIGAQAFLQAIEMSDDRALSKVSGIGAKKAEQIVVQLKHKVAQLIKSGVDLGDSQHIAHWQTVTQALESLNYSRTEITHAMNHLKGAASDSNVSFDQLMRQALSYLAKQQR